MAGGFKDEGARLMEKRAGGLCEAPRREGRFCYWLGPLLAASACCIFFAISALTASRLKLAPLCIGGQSKKGLRSFAPTSWTETPPTAQRSLTQVGDLRYRTVGLLTRP